METYRIRTLEVLKMRGRQITEGEHAYRITQEGIYLLPARSMIGDYANVTDGMNIHLQVLRSLMKC